MSHLLAQADTINYYSYPTSGYSSNVSFWLPYYTGGSAILGLIALISMWKVFTKAGQPGWGAIIPIYNVYLLLKIAQRPGWWLLLFLIPVVNVVMYIILMLDLARVFGKSVLFAVLALIILPIVGYIMLAFGSATYLPSSTQANTTPTDSVPPANPAAAPSTSEAPATNPTA